MDPPLYMGNTVSKVMMLENEVQAWVFSSSQYIQNAACNVEEYLTTIDCSLPKQASATFTPDSCPQFDSMQVTYYQSLIGTFQWIVELGCVDITAE